MTGWQGRDPGMKCRHVEELMPLYVESDLPADEMRAVAHHLKDCEACARLCREFGASQVWLQSYVPPAFDEAFYTGLQESVIREIQAGQRRPLFFERLRERWFLNPAFALAALLLIAGAVALAVYLKQGEKRVTQQAEGAKSEPQVQPQIKEQDIVPLEKQKKMIAGAESSHKATVVRRQVRQVVEASLPEPVVEEIENSDEIAWHETVTDGETGITRILSQNEDVKPNPDMLRIEFQTNNPNIRIIWFTPKAEDARKTDTE